MKYLIIALPAILLIPPQKYPSAESILKKVDNNLSSKNSITESQMIIYGRRNNRTIRAKTHIQGHVKSFTEYLSPPREKGIKMLKLQHQLWIYSPTTDRTIQLSGHMLRQSVMGSDLSYEDMMEEQKLTDLYDGQVVGEDMLQGRKVWVLDLTAKVERIAYYKRKSWIDQERLVPLKEELFSKSGQLLKRITLEKIVYINNRWYPKRINYRNMLKEGKGTDFIIDKIVFNTNIPDYLFTKAALKK